MKVYRLWRVYKVSILGFIYGGGFPEIEGPFGGFC